MRRAPATAPRATPPSRPTSSASASTCRHTPRRAGRQQASATIIVPLPYRFIVLSGTGRVQSAPRRDPGMSPHRRGEATIPGPVALALLPSLAADHLLDLRFLEWGRRADHLDLAAAGGAAALAVAARAGPAGGAGHGDRAHGGRGGPPRADRVRPAVGQHAARDRDRAAQPARVRLGQGPRPARGRRRSASSRSTAPVRPGPAARRRAPGSRRSATRLARTIERPAMLAGRMFNPARADEVVVTPQFAAFYHKGVGDVVTMHLASPQQVNEQWDGTTKPARSRHPGPDRRGGTHRLRVLDRGRSSDAGRRAGVAGPVRQIPGQHHGHQAGRSTSTR